MSAYTEEMLKSIAKVESTRAARLHVELSALPRRRKMPS
jgi:hypothetical protein